jgi:hypothetical protein
MKEFMNIKHLAAFGSLLIAVGASSAECLVTPAELEGFYKQPVRDVEKSLTSDEHNCTVARNGLANQFGEWIKFPEATGHPWRAGSVVLATETGYENKDAVRDPEIRVRRANLVVCPEGKFQCALPVSKQPFGREDLKFWAREPDTSMVEVFTRIAEEEGRVVVWVDEAREVAAKPLLDREEMNKNARLRKVYTSAEALQGVTQWYAARAKPNERLRASIKGDTVEVSVAEVLAVP